MLFQLNKLGNHGNSDTGGTLTLTQAGGEAFPVWNTVAGKDKVSRLSIYGKTIQQGIPKPDVPVEFQSVGDSGLILTVASAPQGGEMQTFSFQHIVLRSLSNGVKDEIIYENGVWKHIQRVFVYHVTGRESTSGGAVTNERITGWISVPSKTVTQYIESNRFIRDSSISTPNPQVNQMTLHKGGGFVYVGLPLDALEPGEFLQWFVNNPTVFLYPVDNPVETVLDLPAISTYTGETWFMINPTQVKPCMSASVRVEKEIKPASAPLAWWDAVGRTNTDSDREIIMDKTGRGYNLNLYGFGYTPGSGFNQGVLQCDGVDDYLQAILPEREENQKTIFVVFGRIDPTAMNQYMFFGGSTVGEFLETMAGGYGFFQADSSGSSYISMSPNRIDFTSTNIICFARKNAHAKAFVNGNKCTEKDNLTDRGWKKTLWISRTSTKYNPLNFISALLYDRMLSDQEIQQTTNFLKQTYGI